MIANQNPNSPVFKTGKVSREGNSPVLMLQRVSSESNSQMCRLLRVSPECNSPIARNETLYNGGTIVELLLIWAGDVIF